MNLACRILGHVVVREEFEGQTPWMANGDSATFRSGELEETDHGWTAPITGGVVTRLNCARCGKPWDRRRTSRPSGPPNEQTYG